MSLMLGVLAASGVAQNDYVLIATQEVSTATGQITFSDIPSTYRALELRISSRSTTSSNNVYMVLNSDMTFGNYRNHGMSGGSAFYTNESVSVRDMFDIGYSAPSTSASETYAPLLAHIAGYANTLTMTSYRSLYGLPSASKVGQRTGQWSSLNTVSSIDLWSASSFAAGSVFSLYGYKI